MASPRSSAAGQLTAPLGSGGGVLCPAPATGILAVAIGGTPSAGPASVSPSSGSLGVATFVCVASATTPPAPLPDPSSGTAIPKRLGPPAAAGPTSCGPLAIAIASIAAQQPAASLYRSAEAFRSNANVGSA